MPQLSSKMFSVAFCTFPPLTATYESAKTKTIWLDHVFCCCCKKRNNFFYFIKLIIVQYACCFLSGRRFHYLCLFSFGEHCAVLFIFIFVSRMIKIKCKKVCTQDARFHGARIGEWTTKWIVHASRRVHIKNMLIFAYAEEKLCHFRREKKKKT